MLLFVVAYLQIAMLKKKKKTNNKAKPMKKTLQMHQRSICATVSY